MREGVFLLTAVPTARAEPGMQQVLHARTGETPSLGQAV